MHAKLFILMLAVLGALALGACSSPFGGPDPFDMALGNIMAARAASAQARMEGSHR